MSTQAIHRKFGGLQQQDVMQPGLLAQLALPRDAVAAHRVISDGIGTVVIGKIALDLAIEPAVVCRWAGIDRTTFARRDKSAEKRLSVGQSAAVYSMARALDAAVAMFDGDKHKALNWFRTPARALAGQAPAEMLSTPAGADAVLDLITRIEHGVIS